MKFEPADVCFTTNKKSKLSAIFRWFMRSKWSHVFIVKEQTERETYIVETSSFEVIYNEISGYLSEENTLEVWRPTQLSEDERIAVVDECSKNIEKVYGHLQFISFGIRGLLERIGIRIPNFIKIGLICCELVLAGYVISSIPGISGIDPKSMQTEELYKLVTTAKNKDGTPAFKKVYEQE